MMTTTTTTNRPRLCPWLRPWVLALGMALAVAGISHCSDDDGAPPEGVFPADFQWGVAVAGFQVDMGCPTLDASACLDTGSDWYVWVTDPQLIAEHGNHLSGDLLSQGPGHWELYETDYDLAAGDLGLTAFRTSIEWSRIFPESTVGLESHDDLAAVADMDAVAHYRSMFEAMRARGLEPYVTLHHYTLPRWIHDAVGCHTDLEGCSPRGWLDRETIVAEIAKYAGFVAEELGDLVDQWITQNEPFAVILAGYLFPSETRTNPPGVTMAFEEVKQVATAMIEAHARMYDAVWAADEEDADGDGEAAQVGLVFAVAPVYPIDPTEELDVIAAENTLYLYNLTFLNGVILGELDEDLDGVSEYREDLAHRMDWLGVNYYSVIEVQGRSYAVLPDLSPLMTFDPFTYRINWNTPYGIYEALVLVRDRYPDLPVVITENGFGDAEDTEGAREFLVEHLTWVSRAIRDGVDCRGYFYWSLIDNYEWNQGFGMRFGLYGIDPLDPTKERAHRAVAGDYAQIIAGNRIPTDLLEAYPAPPPP